MTLKYRIATPIFQGRFETLGKRQVKSPKINFRDTGLLHSLLDIPNGHNLLGHPKVGASWEGFVLE
jgi:predicted AAA+ superfamily ATPase